MDGFSLAQHDLVRRWFAKFSLRRKLTTERTPTQHQPPNPYRRSAVLGLWTLGLLNLPVFTGRCVLTALRMTDTHRAWEQWAKSTFPGKCLSFPLDRIGLKQRFLRIRSSMVRDLDIKKWLPLLAFQTTSFAEGRYWTFLTASFVHLDLGHIVANLTFLSQIAPVCVEIPGFSALHAFAVTFIASLAASLSMLAHNRFYPMKPSYLFFPAKVPTGMGFSGVIIAFLGMAVMCSPSAPIPIPGVSLPVPVPCWVVASGVLITDVVGLLQSMGLGSARPGTPPKQLVGHHGHLAGFLVGGLYYLLVLKSRSRPPASSELNGSKHSVDGNELADQKSFISPSKSPIMRDSMM